MEFFKNPELIKLSALGIAFVIGVSVCVYVFVKETMELQQRRAAKHLIYQDEVRREVNRRRMQEQIQAAPHAEPQTAPKTAMKTAMKTERQSFA